MSNILIIKHGSLGDIAQISGVLKDIRENYRNDEIFILTTLPYVELLSKCPYINRVLVDRRLPRWNIIYLLKLKKLLNKFHFSHVFDLQNSTRTSFYKKFLLTAPKWNNTQSTLKKGQSKKDFDNAAVLERFKLQLEAADIKSNFTMNPNFSWAQTNVDSLVNQYFRKKFILLFPFCSPKLPHKKWPHYNELIKIIKHKHLNLEIALAPDSLELSEAKEINAVIITNQNKPLNIMELTGLIKKASYIISNDTGPAHIAAHLGKTGSVIFGHHTTANKVSIETNIFKAINSKDLKNLQPQEVYDKIKDKLELIN